MDGTGTKDESTTAGEQDRAGHGAPVDGAFARVELPPVPTFGARPPQAAGPVAPLRDEPAGGWQSPFPQPEPTNAYSFQVAPPPGAPEAAQSAHAVRLAAAPPAPAMPAEWPATSTTVRHALPSEALDDGATPPAVGVVPTGASFVAVAMLVSATVLLVWTSRMAFSSALMGLAALTSLQLTRAISAARPAAAGMPVYAAFAVTIALELVALRGASTALTGDAFVAGLFLYAAVVPTVLLFAVAFVALRRRRDPSPADTAMRLGVRECVLAAGPVLVAAWHANRTYSATIDSIVALGLCAAVLAGAVAVLRARPAEA